MEALFLAAEAAAEAAAPAAAAAAAGVGQGPCLGLPTLGARKSQLLGSLRLAPRGDSLAAGRGGSAGGNSFFNFLFFFSNHQRQETSFSSVQVLQVGPGGM